MIKTYTYILLLALLCTSNAHAQTVAIDPTETGGAFSLHSNDASHPCISDAQYDEIDRACNESRHRLGLDQTGQRQTTATSLSWPLQMANGLDDCSYYFVSAYVDEDSTAGIKDWHCGTNTYDGHRGTDIAIFPYPFYKMDHDQVEVIAAAAGTILFKSDTTVYDKNCAGNSAQANYIVIQHADGTYAYYFHMKHNSVTTKTVGQTVAVGEHLGIVGSSGNASGPHLHFEVRTSTGNTAFKDPWSGSCNHLNASS
jgi:murein DD-endopeptidase MepM/ murein hydrolase activator NlpD